jgi:hypothetical protein
MIPNGIRRCVVTAWKRVIFRRLLGQKNSPAPLNLTEHYRDQGNMGELRFLEVTMSALFSFAFAGIFVIFMFAAIVGHVLLVDALVRPFFLGVSNSPTMVSSSVLPRPIR